MEVDDEEVGDPVYTLFNISSKVREPYQVNPTEQQPVYFVSLKYQLQIYIFQYNLHLSTAVLFITLRTIVLAGD